MCFLVHLNGIFHSGRISQSPRMPLLGFRFYNITFPCCSLLAANHQIMQNDTDEAKPGNQSFSSPPWPRQCSAGGQQELILLLSLPLFLFVSKCIRLQSQSGLHNHAMFERASARVLIYLLCVNVCQKLFPQEIQFANQ